MNELNNEKMHFDKLKAYGNAPGYRDISLTIEINQGDIKQEVTLKLSPKDSVFLMKHIVNVNRTAWDNGKGKPLDALEDEEIPEWLTPLFYR